MATIYGKVDCLNSQGFSNALDANRVVQENYSNFYKFMAYLESNGVAELVTRYSGFEFWDAANAAGSNAFSVWKMKANAERDWDWYLYIHNGAFNSGSLITDSSTIPTRAMTRTSGGSPTLSSTELNNRTHGLYLQAAICVSTSLTSSVSSNPWNGTINLSGSAQKATPVWTTGANPDNKLFVFPRVNNLSGSADFEKDAVTPFFVLSSGANVNTETKTNTHFLSDGNGILLLSRAVVSGTKPATIASNYCYAFYVGPYRLLDGIISNNPGNVLSGTGSLSFCMFANCEYIRQNADLTFNGPPTHIFSEGTTKGNILGSDGNIDGGFLTTLTYGVRNGSISADKSINTTTTQPNAFAGNRIDGRQYYVYATENGFQGCLGALDSSLFRAMGGSPITHDITSDQNYIIFGANDVATNARIITPWSGSAPSTSGSRGGFNFTKTGFYF